MKGVNLDQLNLVAKAVTKDRMEHALVQLRQLQSHSPGFIPGLNTFSVKGKKKKKKTWKRTREKLLFE